MSDRKSVGRVGRVSSEREEEQQTDYIMLASRSCWSEAEQENTC